MLKPLDVPFFVYALPEALQEIFMSEDKTEYNVPSSVATLVGHVDMIKRVPSRHIVQVIIELPAESFKDAVANFDDENVFVQVASKAMQDLPYGIHKHTDEPDSVSKTAENETQADLSAGSDKQKTGRVGSACYEAIQFCKDENFQVFMCEVKDAADISEAATKDEFIVRCGIDSRKELDTNPAAHKAAQDIYREFLAWNSGE